MNNKPRSHPRGSWCVQSKKFPFKDFQPYQIQRSSCKIFTAHYTYRSSELNLTLVIPEQLTNSFFKVIIKSSRGYAWPALTVSHLFHSITIHFLTFYCSLISRTSLNSVNEKLFHSDLPLTTGIAWKECKNDFINFWLSAKASWFTLKEVTYALYLLHSINILIFNKQ